MVVVWPNFGNTRIELDRYQTKVITDKEAIAKAKEMYLQMYRISPERFEGARKELAVPDDSPEEWENNCRQRYNWRPAVTSENSKFRLFEVLNDTYNGEKESPLRPWVLNIPCKERAVPKAMVFSGKQVKTKNEKFNARHFSIGKNK